MMFMRFFQTLVVLAMFLPASLWAASLQQSLDEFFKKGVHFQGATAELVRVVRLPNITGEVRWKMPTLRRHMSQLSLVAEQGEGVHLRRWYVPVQLRWWANVVTVRQELPARSVLQASMLQVKRMDIAGHMGVCWRDTRDLLGMRTTRALHADDVVFSHMVKRPNLIQRGDRVTILAGNGVFSVRVAGEAMKSANIGERILVQNMRSKRRIKAIVVDAHTVRVQI